MSRFDSRSSDARSFVGGDNDILSPIVPVSLHDGSPVPSPIVQTSDSKQWIDLDYVSPKLLKELRRRYDPSVKDEPSGPIAKGAAKLKAWARHSKLGIDIRLRRRINSDHDEVTDIRLVPDPAPRQTEWQDEKFPKIPELPGTQNEVNEMPDSSVPPELDAVDLPSKRSTGSSAGEPLPRYEPGSYVAVAELVGESSRQSESPERDIGSPSSQAGILAAPTMGISVQDTTESDFPAMTKKSAGLQARGRHPHTQTSGLANTDHCITSGLARTEGELESTYGSLDSTYGSLDSTYGSLDSAWRSRAELSFLQSTVVEDLMVQKAELERKFHDMKMKNPQSPRDVLEADESRNKLKEDINATENKLWEERQVSESLQAVIEAIRRESSKKEDQGVEPQRTESAKAVLGRLKVVNTTTCETETDADPPSPTIHRKIARPGRKKPAATPKRTKSSQKSRSALTESLRSNVGSDEEVLQQDRLLLRKQTLPKRVPAIAGAETLWAALLRAQSKILGPEHPLVYQAKSDLARSRANGHAKGSEDLLALRQSKTFATETLGTVHPWVATFVKDLQTLESLTEAREGSPKTLADDDGVKASESPQEGGSVPSPIPSAIEQPPSAQILTNENTTREPGPERRNALPRIATSFHGTDGNSPPPPANMDGFWNNWEPPHKPRNNALVLGTLVFNAAMKVAMNGMIWLQRNYGPEQPVEQGKVRVRWTCACGERLHDDFTEMRSGAARELEAYLNRPINRTGMHAGTPTSPSSSYGTGNRSLGNSSFGGPPSSQTTWSSYGFSGQGSMGGNGDTKPQTYTTMPFHSSYSPSPEPPWLLTCANEDHYTPKLAHIDMAPYKISSDKILAMSLREHYSHINKKWWRLFQLRGLTTIEFVQFEVHKNRFTDIRKCPDMPVVGRDDYSFEPGDLLPPVGSQYLLHLFKHPEDYDGELITYLRSPKRNGRLDIGVGWGINLVDGFIAHKVWMIMSAFFALGSLAFGITFTLKEHDIQGAFGVSSWMVALAGLGIAYFQVA